MKLFTEYYGKMSGHVLPYEKFRLFAELGGFTVDGAINVSAIDAADCETIISLAEAGMDKPYPSVLASDFIRFYREGNRTIFEAYYFERRAMLFRFAAAEMVEGKGRFIDRVMDGVWLILDEADWVLPAHITSGCQLTPWWREHKYIDLFSAETASILACVYVMVGKKLTEIAPMVTERLLYSLHERITVPFLTYDDMWWMGLNGRTVNNWNPWVISNVLMTVAATEQDTAVREQVVERAILMLDNFVKVYHTDGGCDEGPSYWNVAGASFFDALELLYDMTGGYLDFFGEELVRRMGEYEADFHINEHYFVNFADCPIFISPDERMMARYGKRIGSDKLYGFGAYLAAKNGLQLGGSPNCAYRYLKNFYTKPDENTPYAPAAQAWYDGICVMIERENPCSDKGFFLACKGGHNAESHNHNDVGNFIVYHDGKPLIIDAGVGSYTKKTFSAQRYDIWSMCSDYHNLPAVNGVTQREGHKFCATDVVYDKENHAISMNLATAYPETAGISSLVRSASMVDGVITVRDEIRLTSPGSVVFTLMTAVKPELCDGGILLGDCEISVSDGLCAVIDDFDMDMEDETMRKRWRGTQLYRVLLKSGEFTSLDAEITIRRK